MDSVLHVVGRLAFGVLIYAAIQSYLGVREVKALMAQHGWFAKDFPITVENTPPGGGPMQTAVVSGFAQYWRLISVELILACLLLWFLTR